jgi:hypothetical protein
MPIYFLRPYVRTYSKIIEKNTQLSLRLYRYTTQVRSETLSVGLSVFKRKNRGHDDETASGWVRVSSGGSRGEAVKQDLRILAMHVLLTWAALDFDHDKLKSRKLRLLPVV